MPTLPIRSTRDDQRQPFNAFKFIQASSGILDLVTIDLTVPLELSPDRLFPLIQVYRNGLSIEKISVDAAGQIDHKYFYIRFTDMTHEFNPSGKEIRYRFVAYKYTTEIIVKAAPKGTAP